MTQCESILHYMKSRPIDPVTALRVFRCFRLAARVKELRAQGHPIVTEMKEEGGKRYATYRLAK